MAKLNKNNKFAVLDLISNPKNINTDIKSGTHIEAGRQFLNEHRQKPQLYRMASQPSQAHFNAVHVMESQA